jgi:Protein of unknown function (DUF1572)
MKAVAATGADDMNVAAGDAYLRDVAQLFRKYQELAERAIAYVSDEAKLHVQLDAASNSIAVIMKHVAGNLRSRYTDFLTTDGEKPNRNRDAEFEMPEQASRDEILRSWRDGFDVALRSIEALTPDDLDKTIYIRGEAHSVVQALNRSITHTTYHVGQVVYLARHFAGPDWRPLTIPKKPSR